MPLVVRPSPIHAVGVYTPTAIRKGTRVVEYDGERITPEEADRRYDGASRTYLYGLEDGKTVIDGEGLGAYLNHSCDPNVEAQIWDEKEIWFVALQDIQPGMELLYNYSFDLESWHEHPCGCGSPRCPGYIVDEDLWPKLRKKISARKAWETRRRRSVTPVLRPEAAPAHGKAA